MKIIDKIVNKASKILASKIYDYIDKDAISRKLQETYQSQIKGIVQEELKDKKWKDFVTADQVRIMGKRYAEESIKIKTDDLMKYNRDFGTEFIGGRIRDVIEELIEKGVKEAVSKIKHPPLLPRQ